MIARVEPDVRSVVAPDNEIWAGDPTVMLKVLLVAPVNDGRLDALRRGAGLAQRHPLGAGGLLGMGGMIALVGSLVGFAVLGLPASLVVVPLLAAMLMFGAAGWMFVRARRTIRVTPVTDGRASPRRAQPRLSIGT